MRDEYPLYTLLIEVTQKCNAACDQCGSRCDPSCSETLSGDDILRALADIKENIGTYTMLNVTGGEPLMRADLFDIMTRASAMGFEWGMVSNGALITPDVIEKMRSSGMKTITISVDGLRDTHESLRHLPGSYDKIMTALRRLRAADFLDHLQVTFTVNRRNVYEFEELYRELEKIGLDSIRVGFMDPIGRALDHDELLCTREEKLFFLNLVNRLNAKKGHTPVIWGCPHFFGDAVKTRKFLCFAGIYTASILANGDIFVCPNVERRPEFIQGNILKDSFSDAWKNGFKPFRNRALPAKCVGCEHERSCAGDSFHTLNHETGEPLFCWRDDVEKPDEENFRLDFFKRHGGTEFCEISDGDADCLVIEPYAFEQIRAYFHAGRKHPQSMFEQQMALVGFFVGNTAYARYVIPCDGALRAADNALFTKKIIKTVESELDIINENYYRSGDRGMTGSEPDPEKPMRFLGFIHSHPTQDALQYSTGDESIHTAMLKRYGRYFGVLISPSSGAMGAYCGADFRQARLIIPDTTNEKEVFS